MKKLEILWELPKCNKVSKCWENGMDRLVWCRRIAKNLQFVKKKKKKKCCICEAKQSKVQQDELRLWLKYSWIHILKEMRSLLHTKLLDFSMKTYIAVDFKIVITYWFCINPIISRVLNNFNLCCHYINK